MGRVGCAARSAGAAGEVGLPSAGARLVGGFCGRSRGSASAVPGAGASGLGPGAGSVGRMAGARRVARLVALWWSHEPQRLQGAANVTIATRHDLVDGRIARVGNHGTPPITSR